jgi:hypothetical protein
LLRGLKGELVRAKQDVGYARAGFLERFRDAFGRSVFEVTSYAVRNVAEQLVFFEDIDRVGVGGGIWCGGSARDYIQAIPDHVRNDERDDMGFGRLYESPTFHSGQMLPHRIHFIDRGPGGEKEIGDSLFLWKADIQNGSGPERRTSAGDKAEEEVLGGQGLREGEHALSPFLTGRRGPVFVAGARAMKNDGASFSRFGIRDVDYPLEVVTFVERTPQSFDEPLGHSGSRLPRTDDGDADDAFEGCAVDSEGVAFDAQNLSHQFFRIHGFETGLPDCLCILDEGLGGASTQRILLDFLRLTLLPTGP